MTNLHTIHTLSDIYVGGAESCLDSLVAGRRVIVITDPNIDRLYPSLVHRYEHIIVGYGETSKTLITVQNIYTQLMELGADRTTLLLGIGGGIVTDITGYVAATYMRGVEFGFISTTLLGQVDASVGGKNGVNVKDYKNMVGTFAQPRFVISDVEMLRTLPLRELRAGIAEVIKVGILGDSELFGYLEQHANDTIFNNTDIMQQVVLSAIRLKVDIVERDERESGIRRLLNLGHTIAHAIEKCTRAVNHGEAVAMGLSAIAHASVRRGLLATSDCERIDSLLAAFGFEITPPVSMADILREVRLDKKKSGDNIRVVMPESIGRCRIVEMPFSEFEEMFN